MLNRMEVSKLMAIIAQVFPKILPDNEIDQDAKIGVWYLCLQDIPYSTGEKAVTMVLRESHFEPKPADIVETAKKIKNVGQLTAAEAWNQAICYLKGSEIKLDANVRKAMDYVGETAICMSDEGDTRMMNTFMRIYDTVIQRNQERTEVKALTGDLVRKLAEHFDDI